MDVTKLREGDYCPDGAGSFEKATGSQGVLERAMFLLAARRGSFPFLPEVGSRIYLLPKEKASARSALGASYAAEALAGETDLSVTGAEWTDEGNLTVYLTWQGESFSVAVEL
jgi:hypothetical protein